jgi:hypothetical protein
MANKMVAELVTYERRLSIDHALQSPSISKVSRQHGEVNVLKAITGALMVSCEYFNTTVPFTESQAVQTASLFIDQYGAESLEDILICLKNAKAGAYGTLYNRIDGQVIFSWFQQYLDKKYERLEQMHHNKKKEASDISPDIISQVKQSLAAKVRSQQSQNATTITDGEHFKGFLRAIEDMDNERLMSFRELYEKENLKCLSPHFDVYIKAIDEKLNYQPTTLSK